ncbi:MAG: hypothetical protein E2598_07560 [Sphingobium sp.]|nr:hypothetical protein [Sphingobium sp.]
MTTDAGAVRIVLSFGTRCSTAGNGGYGSTRRIGGKNGGLRSGATQGGLAAGRSGARLWAVRREVTAG